MFSQSIVIIAFAISINGAVLPPITDLSERIIGGGLAQITEAPYQVALIFDRPGTGVFTQACGGIIISRYTVLTAAQCNNGYSTMRWRIRAGSTFHNSGGEIYTVKRFVNHPSFNKQSYDNDIAIIVINTQFLLGDRAKTVILPPQGFNLTDGTIGLMTGWGSIVSGGNQPIQLYKVNIPIVNQRQCTSAYASFNPVTQNMICAGRLGVGGQDACVGDAGGPFTVNGILIGIISWGVGCGDPRYPGVLTKVSMYRNWINVNIV